VTLNANGSGTMMMHYSIPQQLAAMMSMGGQQSGEKKDEMPFKFKEDEVKADLNVKGVRVEKFESKTEGDKQHYYVHLSFDQITDLNGTKTFKEMPFEWKKDGKTVTFQHTLKSKGDKPGTDQAADQMAQAMLGNASFKYKVKLPSNALPAPDTNGTIADDKQTVTWEYPLTELGKGDKVMTAKFETGGLPLMKLIILGGGGLLTLIALIIVISVARKM